MTAAQINDPRSWFGIQQVVLHDAPGAPADELTRFAGLFAGETPPTLADVKRALRGLVPRRGGRLGR